MKLMKRTQIYKATNLTFNPNTVEAHSYSWWRFVAVIEGQVVFNNFRYSPTTARHQYKVRSLMNELGIKIDIEMPIPSGINTLDLQSLIDQAEEHLCDKFINDQLQKQNQYQDAKARKLALANVIQNPEIEGLRV